MKGECCICGSTKNLEKHHVSYIDNEVILLCSKCHGKVHQDNGKYDGLLPDHISPYFNFDLEGEEYRRFLDLVDEDELKKPKLAKDALFSYLLDEKIEIKTEGDKLKEIPTIFGDHERDLRIISRICVSNSDLYELMKRKYPVEKIKKFVVVFAFAKWLNRTFGFNWTEVSDIVNIKENILKEMNRKLNEQHFHNIYLKLDDYDHKEIFYNLINPDTITWD